MVGIDQGERIGILRINDFNTLSCGGKPDLISANDIRNLIKRIINVAVLHAFAFGSRKKPVVFHTGINLYLSLVYKLKSSRKAKTKVFSPG